jgi:hypothetical protein
MPTVIVPVDLMQDRYWGSMFHLFKNNWKLKTVFTQDYFNFDEGTVNITALKRRASAWSQSEKFLLKLALHLFNDRNKVDLGDMDFLDEVNKKLAFEAIKMRYL